MDVRPYAMELISSCVLPHVNTDADVEQHSSFWNWEALDEVVFLSPCHEAQYSFLKNSYRKENLLHAGNGWGKSHIIARKHISFVLKHFNDPKYKTLNVALTLEQAGIVLQYIVDIVKSSPVLSWLIDEKKTRRFGDSIYLIEWANGAKTFAKTSKRKGESIEGFEYGYVSCDEMALEKYIEFLRDLILLPRLRKYKDSQLDFFATPKGMNSFYRVMTSIKSKGGYVQGGSSYENSFVQKSHWDYMCEGKSEAYINQVIHGRFIDNSNFMFASRVDKILDVGLTFESPLPNREYIDGWDLARGRKSDIADYSVRYTAKKPKDNEEIYYIVDRWTGQIPWTYQGRINENRLHDENYNSSLEEEIKNNYSLYNDSDVYIDSTGLGDTLYEMVMNIATGVDFRGGNKAKILTHLQFIIDKGVLKCPYIPELVEQMTTYQLSDENLSTDEIMGLTVMAQGINISSEDDILTTSYDFNLSYGKQDKRVKHHLRQYQL